MDAKSGANIKTAKLSVGDKNWSFPIYDGTIGPEVIDVGKLYAETGMFTYDPGFTSTGACESKITYIDGDEGILLYRGVPIEQLAEHGDFLETCYLLLYGEMPTPAQKADFDYRVTRHTMVHEQMSRFFQGFRRDAHPMAVMTGSVGALSAFYHDSTDISDPIQRMIASIRMIAKMPTLAAMAYKYTVGQPFVYPKNDLDYATNFLRMCFAVPAEDYKANPVLARAMDRIFILHADHEQNASTSTVRLAGSTGANPFACVAAGHRRALGPGPRRRQRSGAEDDRRDRHRRPHSGIHQARQGPEGQFPPDGLRPPRLQELRSARQDHAEDRARGAGRDRPSRRSDAAGGDGARAHRAARRLFHREEALPERRFLFGHHASGDGLPDQHVHRAVRGRARGGLDRAVEGNDRGSDPAHRPAAPALHRRDPARLHSDLAAEVVSAELVLIISISVYTFGEARVVPERLPYRSPRYPFFIWSMPARVTPATPRSDQPQQPSRPLQITREQSAGFNSPREVMSG